jgi:hypothetical protein
VNFDKTCGTLDDYILKYITDELLSLVYWALLTAFDPPKISSLGGTILYIYLSSWMGVMYLVSHKENLATSNVPEPNFIEESQGDLCPPHGCE